MHHGRDGASPADDVERVVVRDDAAAAVSDVRGVDAWVGEGVARVAVGGERGGRGDGGVAVALQRSGNAFTERRQVELALWWRGDRYYL